MQFDYNHGLEITIIINHTLLTYTQDDKHKTYIEKLIEDFYLNEYYSNKIV